MEDSVESSRKPAKLKMGEILCGALSKKIYIYNTWLLGFLDGLFHMNARRGQRDGLGGGLHSSQRIPVPHRILLLHACESACLPFSLLAKREPGLRQTPPLLGV